jgi:hypothetical protein
VGNGQLEERNVNDSEGDRRKFRQNLLQALKPLWYRRFLIGSSFLLVMVCVLGQVWSTSTRRSARFDEIRQQSVQQTLAYVEALAETDSDLRLRAAGLPLQSQEVYQKINHAYLYARDLDAHALIQEQQQLVIQLREQMHVWGQQEALTLEQLQQFEAKLDRLDELNLALLSILKFSPHEVVEQFWGLKQIQIQASELATGYSQVLGISMDEVQGLYLSLAQGITITRLQERDIERRLKLEMLFQYTILAALSLAALNLVWVLLKQESQLLLTSSRGGKTGQAVLVPVSVIGQLNYFLPEEYVAELAAQYRQMITSQRPVWIVQLIVFYCFVEMLWAFYILRSFEDS